MTTQTISPGTRGHFTPLSPFDQLYDFTKVYTCTSVRSLKEMVTAGDDPFNSIYVPAGLGEDEFFRDISDEVVVYVFQSDGEEWVQVPSSYITETPNPTGVEYRNRTVVINLGGLPVKEDIEQLLRDLTELAKDTVGMDVSTKEIFSSDVYYVPYEESDRYLRARDARKTRRKSYRLLYTEALNTITALNNKITLMECAFLKKPCTVIKRPRDADNYVNVNYFWVEYGNQSPVEEYFLSE